MRAVTRIILETSINEEDKDLARAIHANKKTMDNAMNDILQAAEDLFGQEGQTIRVEFELLEDEQ